MNPNTEQALSILHSLFPSTLPVPHSITQKSSLTNQVYLIDYNGQKFIFRVFSQCFPFLINRKIENRVVKNLMELNMYPKVYHVDNKIRLESCLPGETLSNSKIKNPLILTKLLQKLALFHHSFTSFIPHSPTFTTTTKILDLLKDKETLYKNLLSFGLEMEVKKIFQEVFSEEFQKKLLNTYTEYLEGGKSSFCHNDLNCSNVIFCEETFELTILDYEYCGVNPLIFEFANFFNEMASSYENGFSFNEADYPSQSLRNFVFKSYFQSLAKLKETEEGGEEKMFCEEMERNLEVGSLFSHYVWMIVAGFSYNLGLEIDLCEYIKIRFNKIQNIMGKLIK